MAVDTMSTHSSRHILRRVCAYTGAERGISVVWILERSGTGCFRRSLALALPPIVIVVGMEY